jgi:hypothetical protein
MRLYFAKNATSSSDVQALLYGLEPDYECRDMEQSMAHHRDPNIPRHPLTLLD